MKSFFAASASLLALLAALPAAAQTDGNKLRLPTFGPEYGFYRPTDETVRNLFGSQWTALGVGIGKLKTVKSSGSVQLDFDILSNSSNGNRAMIVPVGLGYRIAISEPGPFQLYVGGSGNLVVTQLRAESAGIKNGYRTGSGGSLFIGANLGRAAYVELRYRNISDIAGLNLSGTQVQAGIRF